ncbi:MAG: PAS domain S-box protein [Bacteroidota bacterium]
MSVSKKGVRITAWWIRKPVATGLLVSFFLLILIGFIANERYQIIKEDEHREMQNVLNVVKQNVEQTLRNSYTTALTLALTINDRGTPDHFEAVAAKLIDSNSNFQAVQLVPQGIIKYVYPLKGNEAALNANVFKITNEHTLRAYESIKSRKMYFTGPNRLRQGGIGIIGRLPVYMDNKFWGFSAVVIKLNTFFKGVGIVNATEKKFYFQFSRFNIANHKEEFFMAGNTDFKGQEYESVVISDGNWRIYLVSKNRYDIMIQIMYPFIFGLSLAIVCSLLITTLLKKHAQLQAVADDQATKLVETENKFKTIFEEAAIGIGLVDTITGRFLQVNKKMCEILGYTETELFELSLTDISHPEENVAQSGYADIENGYRNQQRYIHKNGSIKWANIVQTPLLDEEGLSESDIVIVEDVTDLNDSIKMVTEQNKRLLNFSYIVSHNLRSHTSNIQAIVDLIALCESETEMTELISLLKTVSATLNETMINLNKVVNIQTSIDLVVEPLNLSKYVYKTMEVLSDQIVLKQVIIRNHVSTDLLVRYNPAYLESVLQNFIFNAIRYCHPDRQPIVELNSSREGEMHVLEIKDNGIGIDLNKYGDQIFGMYKTFTENPESKGVGLFISKNQIDAMGGKVTVHSVINEGTVFKIYFK